MNLDIPIIRVVPCRVPAQEIHVTEHLFD
jgi:hypothetical protein